MSASLSYSARNVIALVILMFVGVNLHAGVSDAQVVDIPSSKSYKALSEKVALPDLVRAAEFMKGAESSGKQFDSKHKAFMDTYAKACAAYHEQGLQKTIFEESVRKAHTAFEEMADAFTRTENVIRERHKAVSDEDFKGCVRALNKLSMHEWATRIALPGASCIWVEPGTATAPLENLLQGGDNAAEQGSLSLPSYKKAFAVHGAAALVSALVWAGASYKMAKSDNISVLKAFKGLVDQVLSNEVQPTKIQALRLMTVAQFLYHALGAGLYLQGHVNFETGRRYEFKRVS